MEDGMFFVVADFGSGGTEHYEETMGAAIDAAKKATTRLNSWAKVYRRSIVNGVPIKPGELVYSTRITRVVHITEYEERINDRAGPLPSSV